MRETLVPAARLAESCWIEWTRSPQEYFEFMPPQSFRPDRQPSAHETTAGSWEVALDGQRGAAVTFEFTEQIVGWPYFSIDAPAGAIIELMVQEAHQVGGPALLNTHFNSWTRFYLVRKASTTLKRSILRAAAGCNCTFMGLPAK